MSGKVFHIGSSAQVRQALVEAFEVEPKDGPVEGLVSGDVVAIEVAAALGERDDVPGRNAFSACQVYKRQRGVEVYLVVRADDPVGVQLARFVLADGVLVLGEDGSLEGVDQLLPVDRRRSARLIDGLLQRFGGRMQDAEGGVRALEKMLDWEQADDFLGQLQDEETGLFCGPYAALKLDEEFRRSQRFHLPLSLILLDIGAEAADLPEGPDRQALLAEVAAVFLNECRDIDVLGRFTETVFLFLLPGTPPHGAEALARRMLASLGQREFPAQIQPCAGIASIPMAGIGDRKDLLLVAENCLSRARSAPGGEALVTAWE